MSTLARMERQATILGGPPLLGDDDLELLRRDQQREWLPTFKRIRESNDPHAADGLFYHDQREPHIGADQGTVTLSTTDKALYTASAHPVLGGGYFGRIGKKVNIRLFGKITTAATPGNLTIDVYWGSGADATGTVIVSSAAQTLIANQTNISWSIELWIHCRSTGSTGTLFSRGTAQFGTAVIAAGTFLIPASAAVVSGSLDLVSAGNIISIQAKRSGSTAETMTVQDFDFAALN